MSPQASIVPQGTAQQADMDEQSSTGSSAKAGCNDDDAHRDRQRTRKQD